MSDRVIESTYIEVELNLKPEEWKKITEAIKKLKLLMKSMGKDTDKVFSNAAGALKSVSKSITAVKRNSTQLTNTLNKVNRSAGRSVGTFGRIFKSVRKVNTELGDTERKSGKFAEFAKRAGAALAAIGMGKKGVETFASLEEQLLRTQMIIGASDAEFKKLQATVEQLGKKTQFSAKEVAIASKLLARSGLDANKIMSTLPAVLDLAIATEYDLANSASAVTEAMAAFGYGAKDAYKIVDMFTTATNRANISMTSLQADLKNVQASAGGLGVTLEDVTAMIALMGNLGLKGGEAGTALNSFFTSIKQNAEDGFLNFGDFKIRLTTDEGDLRDVNKIFSEITENLKGMGSFEAAQAVSELFNVRGEKAISTFVKLLKENNSSLEDFRNLISSSEGAARESAAKLEGATSGSLARIRASMESIFKSIGSIMTPVVIVLDNLLQLLALFADTLVGKVALGIGFTVLGFVAMAGAGAKAFTMLKDGWGAATDLIPALKKLGGVIKWNAIWSKVLTLEFWLIAAAVVAFLAVGYDLWKFFKGGKSYIGEFVKGFQEWYDSLGYFQQLFLDWITFIPRAFWAVVKSIFKGAEWLINKAMALFGKDTQKNLKVAVNSDEMKNLDLDEVQKNIKVASESEELKKKMSENSEDTLGIDSIDGTSFTIPQNKSVTEKHYHQKKVELHPGAVVIQGSGLSEEQLEAVVRKAIRGEIASDAAELGVDMDD
ncbi:hypothetical protein PM10SUCC1_32330 [Propionigenium maris DSM 9537]|uniref:Phage tail tape measure protein domain-containing protein n=1 Tax=Propionigenium maris DSM 9537 TaxID=1123000 RepID=A0A9W6GPK6_9FUSO|nr:phage tail tape measure protein [Propionigenium maris]GLI57719.1 hypothetical protein PM10SUCC1_32330 [Propionigenium maris DSM 9537]